MRAEAQRPRRIWPWFVGVAAIVIALLIAIVVAGHGPTEPPASSPTSSPTNGSNGPADAEPTGCLGGTTRDAAMILKAAETANTAESGAVEVATAFVRWIQRYPYPTADEAAKVGDDVLATESFTSDLAEYLGAEPDLSGGIVPAGTTYYMNTVPGVWFIEASDATRVSVSIGSGYVIDGELSSTLRSSITVTLALEDGRWKIADAEGTRTPSDLYKVGHPFTGGC